MSRFNVLLTLIAAVIILTGFSCSILPTAGTETGNPDITACLSATLHTFDSLDQWLPSTYLPEGESQLNPEAISDIWNRSSIAKKKADSTTATPVDTAAVPQDSVVTVLIQFDTVIIIDTQLVDDTLIADTLIIDSVYHVSDDLLTSTLTVVRYVRSDSIFLKDTIIYADTLIDTLYERYDRWGVKIDGYNNTKKIISSNNDHPAAEYIISRDSAIAAPSVERIQASVLTSAIQLSPEIRLGVAYQMVSRQTTAADMVISKTYSSPEYAENNYMMDGTWRTSVLLSHGAISYTTASSKLSIDIDFDAGKDALFPTTGDNRIFAMQRTSRSGTTITERVSYGKPFFGVLSDTLYLQHEQNREDALYGTQITKYHCLAGTEDKLDHRQNVLVACSRELYCSDSKTKTLKITIVPDNPVKKGMQPSTARLKASIDFGKGVTGNINGVADFSNKTVYGTYENSGGSYLFNYSITDKEVNLEKIE